MDARHQYKRKVAVINDLTPRRVILVNPSNLSLPFGQFSLFFVKTQVQQQYTTTRPPPSDFVIFFVIYV